MMSIGILLLFITYCYCFDDFCQGDFLKKTFEYCLAEHGGDNALIIDWLSLKGAEDENSKCFRTCLMTNCNYFNEEGRFYDDVPIRLAHILNGDDENRVEAIKEAAQKCLDHMEYDDNICNNGENWSQCIIEQCPNCGLEISIFQGFYQQN